METPLQNLLTALLQRQNQPSPPDIPQNPLYPPEAYASTCQQNSQTTGILPLLLSILGEKASPNLVASLLQNSDNPLSSFLKGQQKSSSNDEQKIPDDGIIL